MPELQEPIKKTVHRLQSALSIYQRHENNQLTYDDLSREDMHFKLRTGADIIVEETGIHVTNPFKFDIKAIHDWSLEQNENIELVLENWSKHYDSTKNRYDNEILPTYKPYFDTDGYDTVRQFSSTDEILEFCKSRILELRMNDDSLDAWTEIEHRRRNIFDILYFLSNKSLDSPKLQLYLNDLSLTNSVTILQSVYEEEPKPGQSHTEYSHKQRQYSIGELLELLQDTTVNLRAKTTRPLVIPNTTGRRLIGDEAYANWSGLQIFDIDCKFSSAFIEKYEHAGAVRDILFNSLKHYPWLLAITVSASGKGLHVYTKVSRMHHIFLEDEPNIQNQKFWYRASYVQKHAAIAWVLFNKAGIDDIYTNNKIVDSALARIGQGIAINYDPEARFSNNFIDLYPTLLYHLAPEQELAPEDWLLKPELLNQYKAWFYDNALNDNDNLNVQKRQGELKLIIDESVTVDGVKQIDMDALSKGDRYSTRWRICNTIMYAYGDTELGRSLCHHILQTEKTGTSGTINSFIRSAVVNRKEADQFTIKQLKTLGVRIGFQEETATRLSDDATDKVKYILEQSDYGFKQVQPDVNIQLADSEFLGMRMNHVISSMQDFKINVIESAPNTGKTEFFKSLAKKSSVCLVIPFTSTIESKIVSDDSINQLFDVYYGDKKVSEIKKGRSVVMTFDKFAALPKSKYNMFDYIAIDESHLLFTSTYRLPVVSQTIENIRTYILEDSSEIRSSLSQVMSVQNLMNFVKTPTHKRAMTKFILMSGTLTGEIDYFKFYGILNYIKVHKLHPFEKNCEIVLSKYSDTRDILLFKEIAATIAAGGKVIHPTNKGDGWAKRVVACVEHILGRTIKYEYYKRANSDEEFITSINKDTTLEGIELLLCSDYLSVGIDIKDACDFSVVFSNDFTAESIEQFNNRLRSTHIRCKIFYDILDSSGMQKPNIVNTNQIEYSHTEELALMISDERSIAQLQKSIQNRSQYFAILGELFSKYFIQDFAGNIKYIRSAFEIEQFELQYSIIARSLLYIKTSLQKKYAYDVKITFIEEFSEDTINAYAEIQSEAKREHDLFKSRSFVEVVKFLSQTNVYDIMQKSEYIWSKDNDDISPAELGLHLGYDSNYLGGCFVITWNKRHKYVLDRAKKFVKRLRALYAPATIDLILDSCTRSGGLINKADINRYERLMKILFDDRKHSLSASTRSILAKAYEYVDPEFEQTRLERFDYEALKSEIRTSVELDYVELTNSAIMSKRRKDNIDQLVGKFIDTLFRKRVSTDTVILEFRKIYAFNSSTVQQSIERDRIFRKILMNDDTEIDATDTNFLSEQHIDTDMIIIAS